ncbi:MAG TPA: DUF5996 family protein [Gemmatimonadaceae bacterium]|nr:DUF5996 family protein [Gemmatimonadaceae bacterium]
MTQTLPATDDIAARWPELPLASWQDTYATLHMWTQIVGKTRLAHAPMVNHWWQVVLYVTPRGLTTSAMPAGDGLRSFSAAFDFIAHELVVQSSDGRNAKVPLVPQSVAAFYAAYLAALESLGLSANIHPVPVEVEVAIPFAEDHEHTSYDAHAAHTWWVILREAHRVFERFRGRFLGKSSPTHFFWGSFDLAQTRFSGRRAPQHGGGAPNCPDYVMVEAYSHECCSLGLWPGSPGMAGPAFYAYAYPEPGGYPACAVRPAGASYDGTMHEFIMPYEVVRRAVSPDQAILDFAQSTYEAAAELGNWDRATLDRPPSEWP